MPDDLNRRIDNKLEDNCCDCDESKNPSSGVCPAPLEHMTNWRTEHTRIRLPEDNFAFQIQTQKINPNDCNCDPIVQSCCYNLNDIPDVVYADFFVDRTLGNAYPCLRPQEGRLGALHSYEMQYQSASGGQQGCVKSRVFSRNGIIPYDIFCPVLNPNLIFFKNDGPSFAKFSFPLKKLLEAVGGSLAEDKRYVDKFTVELRRDRTFDSHALPQTISAVRHIYDIKEGLNGEGYHYLGYYYRENCAPTGVVWSRQPPLDLVTDIPPCEYTQLKAIDCVPKMVWTGKAKTPGGREIQILYFCDGVDSSTGANTFKTMIFHLDEIKNEWGTFKERDFWNIFEKFEPQYDLGDWWSWHEDRDWARFLMYDIWPDEYFLDPKQDYRVMQNYNYLSTIGYREWIVKDDETWTYYKNLSILCKNLYSEYCSKRGYYVPPQESVQLDAPHQATTIRQMAPFFKLDCEYPYNDNLGIRFDQYNPPCYTPILGTAEYPTILDGYEWDDDYVEDQPQSYDPSLVWADYDPVNEPGFKYWHYDARVKPAKGPYMKTYKTNGMRTTKLQPSSAADYTSTHDVSWITATKRETFQALYYATNKKTKYFLNKRQPEKAPILLKLFGRWNCPWTTPSRYRSLSTCGKISFPMYCSNNGVRDTQTANATCVVYKPYYSPPFYKVQVRYSLKDKPVEEHPSTARLYCPKLPESFLETRLVEDISKPTGYRTEFVKQIADFPNGIYPKHLFVTVEKTLIKASGRNNMRWAYDADMSSGSPKWNVAHVFPSSPIYKEYLDNVGPSGGVPWFEPKTISSKYTDLFYRVGFVGAVGTPENLTLVYGEWRDPETFKKEYDRQYYTLEANMQYLDTTTFYDDLVVQMQVTSTDPNTPAGTITVSSLQESFTGSSYHRFTNQDLECPYLELPLVTYKTCLDFGGLYGSDGCVYFPYISPIGEESKIDNDYLSPFRLITPPGCNTKLIITNHSNEWASVGGLAYSKLGYNNPHLGVYTQGTIIGTSGVIGGALRFKNGAYNIDFGGSGSPGNREELYIYGPFRPNVTNAYDCDESDLQASFIEGVTVWPYAKKPFGFLSPGQWVDGSASPYDYNWMDFRLYELLSKSKNTQYPYRILNLNWVAGGTCDTALGSLGCFDGMTDLNDKSKMPRFVTANAESYGSSVWSKEVQYDTFITQSVEVPEQTAPIYINGPNGLEQRQILLKGPNVTMATDAYKSSGWYDRELAQNIELFKQQLNSDSFCNVDTEGTMPTINHRVLYDMYSVLDTVQIRYDDIDLVYNQDGSFTITLTPYYVDRIVIDRTQVTTIDQVRPLSEIVSPRYVYPHGFYFKCIVTA